MNKLRAAVVGVGYFGSRHVDKWAALEDVELAYVVDRDGDLARKIARKHGALPATDCAEIAGKVDVASVAVPTQHHFGVASALLDAGIHVLVEKPLTPTLEEADALVAAAEARGLELRVGHLERFNPALMAVRDRIVRPRFMECHRLAPFKPRSTDVDVVLDLMIHDIDIILSLVPAEVAEVRASGVPVLTDSVDIANARIEFTDGCVANVTASRVSAKSMRKLRVFQPDTYVSIDFESRECAVARKLPGEGRDGMPKIDHQLRRFAQGDSLEAELRAFVDAVRGRARPGATGREGRRALDLALAVSHRIRAGLK
ncbi:MAG TPA: Gfo/Idh/MocA family oxidoreductase [Burkholderiales bacterium]|nr:Gfo/Idh/MocA family oxidoreductase [Burkholderiales bacterium]